MRYYWKQTCFSCIKPSATTCIYYPSFSRPLHPNFLDVYSKYFYSKYEKSCRNCVSVSGKTTAPKSYPLFCSCFKDNIPSVCATLCQLPRCNGFKMLVCKGCCVWGGACLITPPGAVKIFPRLKNSAENISNFQITFPQTEVLENILN